MNLTQRLKIHRAMNPPAISHLDTRALRKLIEVPQAIRFWGHTSIVTPALCGTVFGDGKRLLGVWPAMFRPNHIFIRIGSDSPISDDDDGDWNFLESIYDAIEDYFYEWPWADEYFPACGDDECACECDKCRPRRCSFVDGSVWGEVDWPKGVHFNERVGGVA